MEEIHIEMSEAAKAAKRRYEQEWRDKHREHLREYQRNWKRANRDRIRQNEVKRWERKAMEYEAERNGN